MSAIRVSALRGQTGGLTMPLVLVISSYVAASRVGGGIAPFVLGPMKVDPVLVPTCLFGRHPGWGPPGGGAVDASMMERMLEGIEANDLFPMIDAVITGHFSTPGQVAVACDVIDRIREAPHVQSHAHAAEEPIIIVDPIMGDMEEGLYVKPPVADALMRDLVPLADVLTPNLWEFQRITGQAVSTPEDIAKAARVSAKRWLISSVPSASGIGVMHADVDNALLAETPRIEGEIPNGTGDMLALRFAGGLVSGFSAQDALAEAVGATEVVIRKAVEWQAPELPLAACSDLLAKPPRAPVRSLS
jgi:pyridoxine kinase